MIINIRSCLGKFTSLNGVCIFLTSTDTGVVLSRQPKSMTTSNSDTIFYTTPVTLNRNSTLQIGNGTFQLEEIRIFHMSDISCTSKSKNVENLDSCQLLVSWRQEVVRVLMRAHFRRRNTPLLRIHQSAWSSLMDFSTQLTPKSCVCHVQLTLVCG